MNHCTMRVRHSLIRMSHFIYYTIALWILCSRFPYFCTKILLQPFYKKLVTKICIKLDLNLEEETYIFLHDRNQSLFVLYVLL